MGYYTEFTGSIYYGDLPKINQNVIEKVLNMIDLISWNCSTGNYKDMMVDYYTRQTEWIHFSNCNIDVKSKTIDISGERKDYHDATATLLYFISQYLNSDNIYEFTMIGECEEEESIIQIKKNKVYVNNELFKTDNKLAFPFPRITYKYFG